MADSNTGRAGRFKKGEDPRRNKHGQKSKAAVEFGAAFAKALAEQGSPDKLAKMLWEKALYGQSWAVDIILDRLVGKVAQPIEGEIQANVAFIMPRPGKEEPKA